MNEETLRRVTIYARNPDNITPTQMLDVCEFSEFLAGLSEELKRRAAIEPNTWNFSQPLNQWLDGAKFTR